MMMIILCMHGKYAKGRTMKHMYVWWWWLQRNNLGCLVDTNIVLQNYKTTYRSEKQNKRSLNHAFELSFSEQKAGRKSECTNFGGHVVFNRVLTLITN